MYGAPVMMSMHFHYSRNLVQRMMVSVAASCSRHMYEREWPKAL